MATVYRAIQEGPLGFEPEVALKLFDPSLVASQPAVVGMIVDEARIASRIKHPGVVRIIDLVEDDGQLYTVMDCIDGPSMRQILDACRLARRTADASAIVAVIAEACEGLHAAHTTPHPDGSDTGLVHRDVKPGNILLTAKGEVRLSDFGIAIFSDRIADATAHGQLKGTPAYMSPEQVFGEPMDARSDIFSMGITLYTLCTSRLAFTGDSPMKIAVRIAEEPMDEQAAELEALLPGLGPVFARACAKEPSERYDSAALFGEALRTIYEAQENPQRPVDLIEQWSLRSSDLAPTPKSTLEFMDEDDEPETDPNLAPLGVLQDEPTDAPTHPGGSDQDRLHAAGAGFADLDEAPTEEIIAAPRDETSPKSSRAFGAPPEEASKSAEIDSVDTPALGLKPLAELRETLAVPGKSIDARPHGDPPPTSRPITPPDDTEKAKPAYRPERDYRGRVVQRKEVDPKTLVVSRGEKIGVALTGVLLFSFTVIILIVQLREPADDEINPSQSETTVETLSTETPEATEDITSTLSDDLPEEVVEGKPTQDNEGKPAQDNEEKEIKNDKSPTPVPKEATETGAEKKTKRVSSSVKKNTGEPKVKRTQPEEVGVGLLSINTYPYSQVWVDGKLKGQTPMRGLELPVGLHKVKLVFPTLGNQEEIETVRIKNGKTSKLVRRIQVETEAN